MEVNKQKVCEAEMFHYENAGQFRAIAAILGYKEDVNRGNITFSKGDEHYTYSIQGLKAGNKTEERDGILEQSKERISTFFNKEEASNNFEEYSRYLKDNHNVAIVKWDNIKAGGNKTIDPERTDGFTVIDLNKKIAYTGEELYKYAHETNRVLDGQGTNVEIPWDKFQGIGVNPENIKPEDIKNLENGMKTGMMNFSIEDNPTNRQFLDKEKVDYKIENGKLNFEGKATLLKYTTAENTQENKDILKKNDIHFREEEGGKRLKIEGVNARKLAIAAITVVYPIAGIAILLVPKRNEIKNDFSFSKNEINALKKDAVISKTNSKGEKVLYQRDKETNEVVSVKAKDIRVPNKIGGVQLSPIQYEELKNGKEITITNEELNKSAKVRLDLNSKNGLSIQDANKLDIKEQQSIKNNPITPMNEQIINPEKLVSDKERLEFIAQKGGKGIDDIFKEKVTERELFLEKYNLSKDYTTYKDIEKNIQSSPASDDNKSKENIHSQKDKIDAAIKATASKEAITAYGKAYGKSTEQSANLKI